MRKIYLQVMIFTMGFLLADSVKAQTGSIHGQILNTQKKPIAAAAVLLLAKTDSSTQKTVITDDAGNFAIDQVQTGSWLLSVNAVGYKKHYSSVINIHQQKIQLPAIVLEEATAKEMASVVVTANKPYTEQKVDRTVVNVDALISNTGTSALEVLEKTPGVLVDENGNITFKGKQGVLVLIDDKPTYLSAADLAAYLKSLPSSALDKIELMDMPPSKYDAAGNAGVINIKTKKTKTKGFNGSLAASYGQAYYWRTNQSLNLNYYTGKVNLFANVGYNINNGARDLEIKRAYYNASGALNTLFVQENFFTPVGKGPNYKLGFDYYISPKTTWGIVYTGSGWDRTEFRPTYTHIYNGAGKLDSFINASSSSDMSFRKHGVNLNYTHKFDSLGKTITFDLDYINYLTNNEQGFLNEVYNSDGVQKSSQFTLALLPSNISIYAAKTDYSQPLPGKAKFEAGLKSSFVNSDNEAQYYLVNGGTRTVDYNNTNHFIYKENINAAYVNLNKEFSRITVQSGLRMENTNGSGHQFGNALRPDSSFTNHYTNLFATLYVSYKLDSTGNNILTLSYGRRIDRPNYQNLNPFVYILDKFSYFAGNPFLRPQFSNELKLSYTYKNKVTIAALYNHISDVQVETIEQKGNIFLSRNGNIGSYDFVSLSGNATLHPAKWWTLILYAEYNYNKYQGALNSGQLNSNSNWLYTNINNQFVLGKGWSAELSGFYCGPAIYAQFDKIPFGQVNPAIQKKVLKDKGTVKLSARDIFNTNTSAGNINNIPNVQASFRNNFYNQSFTIGFTYSFGKQLNKEQRKTGSADSEAGRVGN